ncbi:MULTISPECIES: M28 family metallopeptidase [Pontibacter]|uniref:Zn-dependent amino-or carboxypeptidase, M28 family n=1 Tax=Pontibacter lucknowensis TaxID=1077936 RepID=A0A1N7B3C9_9BACT|nr:MULTISPECIES: M28 family metallopeptidase [Pontibacter]EJF09196.1 peptidase M28 [Pontibacter sp. BAB1700]SIR45812.1 Zn-dependent amino-or carboxypeptidase, M28 family [Pontibacter lucknowensis]
MKRFLFLALSCGLLLQGSASAQSLALEKPVEKSLKKVKPNDIKAHIKYLADDRLLGRKPGTEGYQMAVDYVVEHYQKAGIEPGGENGTYLQLVRLRQSFPGKEASMVIADSMGTAMQLTYNKDFSVYPHAEEPEVSIEAPLVFAGYGISAPDLGYDDYAGIDVTGKIVVVLRGAPASFPSTVSAYSRDMMTVLKIAAEKGAVGVIVANTNPKAGVPNLQGGTYSVMDPNGKVAVSRNYVSDKIRVLASINSSTFEQLLKGTGIEMAKVGEQLQQGKPASTPLAHTLRTNYTSTYKDFESHNVIGKITGADPQLQNEYVVHSAHLDHVGVGRAVNGDSIYNGAHDNASGVASVLEIAKIYSRLSEKPKRSVLFVMVTAEEMGLLGSAYFARFPTVPVEQIVANINTDMPTIIAPLLSVVGLGANHSSLENEVAAAANHLGLAVEEDPEPEQMRFIRSDQYSFVMQGIPALHIKYGNKTKDGLNNLNKQVEQWRAVHYHKPQDNFNDTFDYKAGKKYVQLNFLISYQVANNPQRPSWKAGDFFGSRFGRQL